MTAVPRRRTRSMAVLAIAVVLATTWALPWASGGPVGSPSNGPPPPKQLLMVREAGLPSSHLNWSLLITSSTERGKQYFCTNSTFLDMEEPGVVSISIFPDGEYQPDPAFGSVDVFGGPAVFYTNFTFNDSILGPPQDNGSGGSSGPAFGLGTPQLEFLAVVAVVAAVASILVFRIRRPPTSGARVPAPAAPTGKKRAAAADDDAEPEDPKVVARRNARRERREGSARDRGRGRPKPEASASPAPPNDADEDDA